MARRTMIKIATILAVTSFALSESHIPKVYEYVEENVNEAKPRNIRDSDLVNTRYSPPVFNFHSVTQQDPLKARYFQQQRSDMINLKRLNANKNAKSEPTYDMDTMENDLEGSASKIVERKHPRYIYIQPSILKNNFGLDSEAADEILRKSTPNPIATLEDLIGKNPHVQLEGLQRLLKDSRGGEQLNLNDFQKQLDAVATVQTETALAQAQRQAQEHVEAQNKAIAHAQKQIQEAALARIAAHNNGHATIDLEEVAKIQEEAIAHLKPLGLYRPEVSENSLEGFSVAREESAFQKAEEIRIPKHHNKQPPVGKPQVFVKYVPPQSHAESVQKYVPRPTYRVPDDNPSSFVESLPQHQPLRHFPGRDVPVVVSDSFRNDLKHHSSDDDDDVSKKDQIRAKRDASNNGSGKNPVRVNYSFDGSRVIATFIDPRGEPGLKSKRPVPPALIRRGSSSSSSVNERKYVTTFKNNRNVLKRTNYIPKRVQKVFYKVDRTNYKIDKVVRVTGNL